ncbi:Uncharacterised protein [uncultured archaeon]|nr:Uncharacterised protein [uncultured archaeon]
MLNVNVKHVFDFAVSYRQNKSHAVLEFEREYVLQLLMRNDGNITQAAKEANMDRKHLSDLAKKHRIDIPRNNVCPHCHVKVTGPFHKCPA